MASDLPTRRPAGSSPRAIERAPHCSGLPGSAEAAWRACERILAAACFTHQLAGSPTSVLPRGLPPGAGGAADPCCCGGGADTDASSLCASPDCCLRAEAIARRLHRREYDSPAAFAADVAALLAAAKARGGASAAWARSAELDFRGLWAASGLAEASPRTASPGCCAAASPGGGSSPRGRSGSPPPRAPRLSASRLKLASAAGAVGAAADADAAGADSRWSGA